MPTVFKSLKIQVTSKDSAKEIADSLKKAGYDTSLINGNASRGSWYYVHSPKSRVRCDASEPTEISRKVTLKQLNKVCIQKSEVCIQESETKVFDVSKEFIESAHSAADLKWKRRLEKKFPEAFTPSYDFGESFTITTSSGPLYIAKGIAPSEADEGKLLIVDNDYTASFETHSGRQMIRLVKK